MLCPPASVLVWALTQTSFSSQAGRSSIIRSVQYNILSNLKVNTIVQLQVNCIYKGYTAIYFVIELFFKLNILFHFTCSHACIIINFGLRAWSPSLNSYL